MNEEIKRTYESLPEEEKEQLQKYQKKGITKVTQSVDQETGEILSTETTYSSEKKRVKGTFGISSPEEIIKALISPNDTQNLFIIYSPWVLTYIFNYSIKPNKNKFVIL